ncbi:hypothetical protein PG991_011181 [Apiospora marii]|uniref:Derlin n=1 Tax=Apiospora marii TaxID=335849 RepID=A0ABR1RDS3_9PEZI
MPFATISSFCRRHVAATFMSCDHLLLLLWAFVTMLFCQPLWFAFGLLLFSAVEPLGLNKVPDGLQVVYPLLRVFLFWTCRQPKVIFFTLQVTFFALGPILLGLVAASIWAYHMICAAPAWFYGKVRTSWSCRSSPVNPPTDEQAEVSRFAVVDGEPTVQVARVPVPVPPQPKPLSIAEPPSRRVKFEVRQRQQPRTVTTFSRGLEAFQKKQKRNPLMTQSVNPHAPGYRRPDPWGNVSAGLNPDWVKQQRQRGIDKMDKPKPEPVLRSDIFKADQAHGS